MLILLILIYHRIQLTAQQQRGSDVMLRYHPFKLTNK